ncbi:MAG TPA: AAA family ATPase [Candidatus Nanopelagicaceae bacterium]|nr:AAA family ATPase [Candidatus Nanopelagicaceae bacterium]
MAANRSRFIDHLSAEIAKLPRDPYLRVAVDGRDGSGKTTFADQLATALLGRGQAVIRATIDDFHHPSAIRYSRGKDNGSYRRGVFDLFADSPHLQPLEKAVTGSILLIDGIFLHRPELIRWWNYSIWLEVKPEVSFSRMKIRDGIASADPMARTNIRYHQGQQIYIDEVRPQQQATRVVDNDDFAFPKILA